jgi:hypothetical protein
MKARTIVFAALVLAAAAGVAWYALRDGSITITLTQADVERELAKRFPMRKTYLQLLEVVYENPRVVLTNGSDVLGIGVDARVAVPLKGDVKGAADLRTKLAYDPERTAFVLHDPKVERVQIDGLDPKVLDRVREIANGLAVEQLPGIPVYTLKPTDYKRTAARLLLRSVTVRDGVLVLELGV